MTTGLTDEQLRAIGSVASEWAHLEYYVHDGFAAGLKDVYGVPYQSGRILAANIRRLPILFKITEDLGLIRDDRIGAFKSNWDRVNAVTGERNNVIHGTWHRYIDEPDLMKGRLETTKKPRDLEQKEAREIEWIAKKINLTAFALHHFFREKPWPSKDHE